jgi:hypothetical protein
MSLLVSYFYSAASPVAKERLLAIISERFHRQPFLGLRKIILGPLFEKKGWKNVVEAYSAKFLAE